MDESAYLASYDRSRYVAPLLSVDAVLFTYHDEQVKVLVVRRSRHPEQGKWALPGGFVDEDADDSLDDTVHRKIVEKTGVKAPYLEQLRTFGNSSRDKRGWSVTVVYTALIAHQSCAPLIETVSDAKWMAVSELADHELAFDHGMILQAAIARLRQKALYSIVPAFTLPDEFTLPELQRVHEALLGKPLEKKSFRRRIEQADLLIETGFKQSVSGRPATLYRLKPGAGEYTFLRNLEQ
ncbi:NUDIX hydrolase [Allohahella marinimesophila]|uniref:NUDIX domain-containing protein n=1 Tax=Allohahella marinimesophila TaxID=1054972 RepID=A0ABP7PWB8_9GAMM